MVRGDRQVPRHRAFTLVEMLVVIVVIVLALFLAVPAIRALTGTKSEQTAQNTISAFIANMRAEAIGLQQPRGVLFLLDRATNRVVMEPVRVTSWQTGDPTSGLQTSFVYLDLVPNMDAMPLPAGIRPWTIMDQFAPSQTSSQPVTFRNPIVNSYGPWRYLGYNEKPYTATAGQFDKGWLGGVILFDGQGRLLITPYGFRFVDKTSGTAATALQQLLRVKTDTQTVMWPPAPTTLYLRSQVGFVLLDRETITNLQASQTNPDGNNQADETTVDQWIDANATPILVNRNNGTLIRAE